MAESTHNQDSESSSESGAPPVRRTRRRAGAPAGAPAPVQSQAPELPAQPRTVVPEQGAASVQSAVVPAAKRPRRRAGAPAGAPSVSEQPQTSAAATPVTSVGSASVVTGADENEPAARAAETPEQAAAADDTAAEQVPGADDDSAEAREPSTETDRSEPATTAAAQTESAGGASTDAPLRDREDATSTVADDLRSLASARSGAAKDGDEERAARRERAQLDFASLLFQAPAPARPRTPVGANDAPVGSVDLSFEFGIGDMDVTDGDDPDAATDDLLDDGEPGDGATSRRGSRAAGRSRTRRSRSTEPVDTAEGEADSGSDGADDAEDDDSSADETRAGGTSRRRRRRGGRGRRGRGRGDDDRRSDDVEDAADNGDLEASDDTASEGDGSDEASGRSRSRSRNSRRSSGAADAADFTDGDQPDESDDASDDEDHGSVGSGSSRRRRRRRRSGTAGDDVTSPDDPPNTVVKVREARDEVKAVKGSTRLEAKKQRRREGRDAGRRRSVITEAEFLARRESVKRSMIVRERPGRTQIAVLEDNILVEHYVAQKTQTSMVGNVYLGKVQNVLPSMEAAFVDIGKGRNAVLYAGEVNWDAAGMEGQPRRIELALKSGDPVLVQVTKDPIGHKGARLTSQISLPGRYLVFVPGGSMTGISRKLPENERARLKKLMRQLIPEDAGVIVRTAAEGASEEELTHDVERLRAQWDRIQKAQKAKSAPVALSQEPDIAIKVVRDIFNEDFTSLIVEGDKVHQDIHEYVSDVAPDLLERVTKHVGEKDAFAKYRIDEQLLKAMDRKVYLPSGGSLVIDRTEAMTVVDVNTGKFTGSGGSLEETVTKNNLEAAEEIVRQLRLRDIGGIIVIDFIDMVLESNRDLVLRRLVECLGRDRTKHQVAEVTSLGLVQMTRKRVGQGLVETFSSTCEHCNGRGLVVEIDGHEHSEGSGHASGNGAGAGNDSSRSSKRRNSRRARAEGAKDTPDTAEEVHRLEDDADSRALARATIASIAAASSSHTPAETPVGERRPDAEAAGGEHSESTDQVAEADHAARAAGSGGAIPVKAEQSIQDTLPDPAAVQNEQE